MKKSGFTLAEILISLMILGVIASLTIPSLIQNTQKKEEVVKIKKGISMLSQALAMEYALKGEEFRFTSDNDAINMFKNRLSVTASDNGSHCGVSFQTSDGLIYSLTAIGRYNPSLPLSSSNYNLSIQLFTKNVTFDEFCNPDYDADPPLIPWQYGSVGNLNGSYLLYCGDTNCIEASGIVNAADPTKAQ